MFRWRSTWRATSFDSRRIRAVDETKYRRKDEQGLDAEHVPDPAAEKGDEDAYQVIYRNAGRNRCAGLFRRIGKIFDIDIWRHRGERYHRIEDIVHAADDKSDIPRKNVVGEAVEKAD